MLKQLGVENYDLQKYFTAKLYVRSPHWILVEYHPLVFAVELEVVITRDRPLGNDRNGHSAFFEVKVGKTSERAVRESRERSAEQLFPGLESVASAEFACCCSRILRNSASTSESLQG